MTAAPLAPADALPAHLRRWDLYVRVIDNFGDVGVGWRLARMLADRGARVRLWIDDDRALEWMAPQQWVRGDAGPWRTARPVPGAPAQADAAPPIIHLCRWPEAGADAELPRSSPPAVVVELFGCEIPAEHAQLIAERGAAGAAPVWINLEYLSAESYVERSHALPSPQASGVVKWFYYPGFSPRTGGLLWDPPVAAADAFATGAEGSARMLSDGGLASLTGAADERIAFVFCYADAPLEPLLKRLPEGRWVMAAAPGAALQALRGCALEPRMRVAPLPYASQPQFDAWLREADFCIVRGEDSLVQAMAAARPFVWQLYVQHDGAHHRKLQAWLQMLGERTGQAAQPALQQIGVAHALLNRPGSGAAEDVPPEAWDLAAWGAALRAVQGVLSERPPLPHALIEFAISRAQATDAHKAPQ